MACEAGNLSLTYDFGSMQEVALEATGITFGSPGIRPGSVTIGEKKWDGHPSGYIGYPN